MAANNSDSYLPDLNQLVDQYNNTYHHSVNKETINADYSALTEELETNSKSPKFKVHNRVRITKYKSIYSNSYIENWSTGRFIIDLVLKTNSPAYKIKDSNREKIIVRFYEK